MFGFNLKSKALKYYNTGFCDSKNIGWKHYGLPNGTSLRAQRDMGPLSQSQSWSGFLLPILIWVI